MVSVVLIANTKNIAREIMNMNITFYNSTEEMLNDLSQAMLEADDRVKPWQVEIKKGDYYMQETIYGFNIYGEVLRNAPRAKHLRHYRFVKAYSLACSDGEPGDVHLSVISGILTREEFEEKIRAL